MLIRYNKLDEYTRDRIRFLENKGHIGYIRYLLMRRLPFKEISAELLRLGLSGADESDYALYFETALLPVIQKYKLATYYKLYSKNIEDKRLNFEITFKKSEVHRKNFCECIKEMEVDCFFAKEIREFYGTNGNIPLSDKTGEPIITTEKIPDWAEFLNHPKRYVIDGALVDGKTPRMISDYLDKTYDIQMSASDISQYAKAFFRTKRRDLERTIEDLEIEKDKLKEGLHLIKEADESTMTIGEKSVAIASIKNKIEQIDTQLKRLTSHHGNAAFNEGVLEFAQMREMFADVMRQSHKRFMIMNEKTEEEVVNPLNTIVSMMAKATDKILSLEDVIKESTKKSVVDEMLEVVMPSLDRIEEEERQAQQEYAKEYNTPIIEEDDDILGLDEE